MKQTVLTGATGGIGRVTAHKLASEGTNLTLVGRDQASRDNLRDELAQKFPDITIISHDLDFEDYESHKTLAKTLTSAGCTVEGLIVMPPQDPPTEGSLHPPEIWDNLFRKSFIGPMNLVRELRPLMSKTKIVIVSGISSAQVLSHYATSNVLRTAWLGQAKTMAANLGPAGIHVNTLSLGGVMTDKYCERLKKKAENNNISFAKQLENEVSNVPLRKYAKPEEVATSIHCLLGSFADHFTGHNFICDGGFTRAY